MNKTFIGLACLMTLCGQASAQQAGKAVMPPDVRGVLSLGITRGGNGIGNDMVSTGIQAGAGTDLRAGVEIGVPGHPVAVELSLGYDFRRASGDDSKATFSRVPLDVIAHFNLNQNWRLGMGARKSLRTQLDVSGPASAALPDQKYSSSLAPLVELEYLLMPEFGIKARYVSESFKPQGGGKSLSANHAGIYGSFYF